jgi:hypothetical protein
MAHWLHAKQEEKLWTAGGPGEGVVIKRARGLYTCAPEGLAGDGDDGDDGGGGGGGGGLFAAVRGLNVKVSFLPSTGLCLG